MKLHQIHLEFWRAKKGLPSWADQIAWRKKKVIAPDSPSELINACVNGHAGGIYGMYDHDAHQRHNDAANLMNLCRMVTRRGVDLVDYLNKIAENPGTVINPHRRARYARQWAKRIALGR